jgi:hypothetical protein
MESQEVPMTFTCDTCHTEYHVESGNALAYVFLEDRRCNHLVARCTGCGTNETIFLGPHRFADEVRLGRLTVIVEAEASSSLRVRAETAWAAADRSGPSTPSAEPANAVPPHAGEGEAPAAPAVYELTPRHEQLLDSFGRTLASIPDELLWDGLESEHDHRFPERWTD